MAALFVCPIRLLTVKYELREATRYKMFSYQRSRMRVVLEDARKFQLRPAKTEIYGRLFRLHHEVRKVIACREGGEDAIAVPAPGNDSATSKVRGEMPIVFKGIFFHTAMKAVIVPARRDQDSLP